MKAPRFWLWALVIVAVLVVAARCSADERWTRAVVADDVAVSVAQVSELELARLRAKHEERGDHSALARVVPKHRYGFAILYRDKATRALRCEVYVADASDAATLEHELRHCHGWVHQ